MESFFKKLMSIHSAEDGGVSLFGSIFRTALFAVLFVVMAIAVMLALDLSHQLSLRPDLSKIGAIGDFIGGILNPILAFLVLLVLLATTRLQREELADTRRELKKSASAAEKQAFENTFFNLLELINGNVQSSSITTIGFPPNQNEAISGIACFRHIISKMRGKLSSSDAAHTQVFPKIFRTYHEILGKYIRTTYSVLTFLREYEDNSLDEKSIYRNILRAQISDYELAILFYHCLSDTDEGDEFVRLAKRFDLFDSLSDDLIFDSSHLKDLQLKYDTIV